MRTTSQLLRSGLRMRARKNRPSYLRSIYWADVFLSFHYALIIYINSSFLEKFFSSSFLSLLFIVGAVVNLFILINAPKIIKKIGNKQLMLIFITLEAIAILGLIFLKSRLAIALLFVLYQAVILMIVFGLDIFLEDYSSTDESDTGNIRGTYLTISDMVFVISPMIAGFILDGGEFWRVYTLSLIFLIPLFITVKSKLRNPVIKMRETSIRKSFSAVLKNPDLCNVFKVQFLLSFFYTWMTIYVPIHLYQNIGFSWPTIGIIFTIMLLPFVIFTIPLGRLADKRFIEKEIMATGFIISSIAVAFIPFIREASFVIWAILLFMTRVGASFIEISSESYFFKHVDSNDPDIISLFRVMKPLALVVAPAVAIFSLFIANSLDFGYAYSFLALAIIMFYGAHFGLKITDIKKVKSY